MKAVVCTELGEPSKLKVQDIDLGDVGDNQLLISVEAAGVNFPDALLVQGKYQVVIDPPFIPGNEIAGIVKEVGKNVRLLEMFGLPGIKNINQYYKIYKISNFEDIREFSKSNSPKGHYCPIL